MGPASSTIEPMMCDQRDKEELLEKTTDINRAAVPPKQGSRNQSKASSKFIHPGSVLIGRKRYAVNYGAARSCTESIPWLSHPRLE